MIPAEGVQISFIWAQATSPLDGAPHYAPDLIDIEFARALRKLVMRGTLEASEASQCIEDWSANSLIRCNHTMLLTRIWALPNNITPCDATHVALAEALEVPLVTADRRLAHAAAAYCDVITVGDDEAESR